jgi:DNA-binding transcriptional LysR family regulator
MPLLGLRNELKDDDLNIIPLKGLPIITKWNLVWLKEKKLSPVAEAFLEYIKTNKDSIIDKEFDWYKDY